MAGSDQNFAWSTFYCLKVRKCETTAQSTKQTKTKMMLAILNDTEATERPSNAQEWINVSNNIHEYK